MKFRVQGHIAADNINWKQNKSNSKEEIFALHIQSMLN